MAFDSILVSTGVKGYPYDDVKKTEIININDTGLACKDIEEYPLIIYGAVGFNLGSLPVICGGDGHSFNGQSLGTVKQCYRLESGKWHHFAYLLQGYVCIISGLLKSFLDKLFYICFYLKSKNLVI